MLKFFPGHIVHAYRETSRKTDGAAARGWLHSTGVGDNGKPASVPSVFELFFLLGDATVDVGSDRRHLELRLRHLGFLDLQSRLRFFQRGLQLLLFQFQPASRLVHLVHVPAALAQLVRQVVDLVWKFIPQPDLNDLSHK